MRRISLSMLVLVMVLGLLAVACEGPAGPAGEKGEKGDQGSGPTEGQLVALIDDALAGPAAPPESVARGGKLYDKWWAEADVSAPTDDHPLWELQTTNTRSGSATWRCKECHSWDYKGAGGTYATGSHFTGFPGVLKAGATMSKAELLDVLHGATDFRHDFSDVLGADALADLANFLSEGLINDTPYFDYTADGIPPLNANLSNGEALYGSVCAACHGDDGRQILIEDELGIGAIARDEPTVEILHKVRFGQPGTGMPSSLVNGWSVQEAVDVLAYVQTLGQ